MPQGTGLPLLGMDGFGKEVFGPGNCESRFGDSAAFGEMGIKSKYGRYGKVWQEIERMPFRRNTGPVLHTNLHSYSLVSALLPSQKTFRSPGFWLLFLYTRLFCSKVSLIHDFIVDERAEMACITEIC